MSTLTPAELHGMREALQAFKTAYTEYLENPTSDRRSRVIRAIPEAEEALLTGGGGYTFTDPPAMGPMRQTYMGLSATAFLHEQRGWGEVHGRPPFELVLEGIESADAFLAVEERKVAERRGRPTYWIDRAVRAALMLPAYIVSVILGESVGKIDRSAWGLPLRVLAVVADALGVYGAGKAFGWW
jgi:hypothetical protein